MVLIMGHKICFNWEIWPFIPKLSLLPFLSGALMVSLLSTEVELNPSFRHIVFNTWAPELGVYDSILNDDIAETQRTINVITTSH